MNDIFLTVQGEGYWTGRTAVFCRFSRCNLWTGREEDRPTAVCRFCDTDFRHGERVDREELIDRILTTAGECRFLVLTGGEPALQIDRELIQELQQCGFYIAIETNGTMPLPNGIDWICVSPKTGTQLRVYAGDELKLVYPQDVDPDRYANMLFGHFWLSPMDGPNLTENTKQAVDYVLKHPQWRLNIQTHKIIGVA